MESPLLTAALVALALLAAAAVWIYARHCQTVRAELLSPTSSRAAVAGPLLPGETRWTLNADGTVTHSMTHPDETGYAVGETVGRSVWDEAPEGSPARAHYIAALKGRHPRVYAEEGVHERGPRAGEPYHCRVALMPLPDGGLYCESWDLTAYVQPLIDERDRALADAERAEARAASTEERLVAVTEQMRSERRLRDRMRALQH